MSTATKIKDSDAVLDYAFNWASEDGTNDGSSSDKGWLQGDTISSYTITAESGITVDSDSNTTKIVIVWLSGGTAGKVYDVACEVVTAGGRTDERTMKIRVKNR